MSIGTQRRNLSILPSFFERALVEGGPTFGLRLFNRWSPDLILSTMRLSFGIATAVRCYIFHRWNAYGMLGHWLRNVDGLLDVMKETGGIVCGPTVQRFFDRGECVTGNLDICTDREGFDRMLDCLSAETYGYVRNTVVLSSFRPAVQRKTRSYVFYYMYDLSRTITLHAINCKPINFLVTCGSSVTIM